MIVYEKNNKLNINFENELDNPDIEIGKNEIKLGDSEITANNVEVVSITIVPTIAITHNSIIVSITTPVSFMKLLSIILLKKVA